MVSLYVAASEWIETPWDKTSFSYSLMNWRKKTYHWVHDDKDDRVPHDHSLTQLQRYDGQYQWNVLRFWKFRGASFITWQLVCIELKFFSRYQNIQRWFLALACQPFRAPICWSWQRKRREPNKNKTPPPLQSPEINRNVSHFHVFPIFGLVG